MLEYALNLFCRLICISGYTRISISGYTRISISGYTRIWFPIRTSISGFRVVYIYNLSRSVSVIGVLLST